ncbi:succinate--CoA ligase subunit alpha [Methanobacterium sp.]|jgi:succinyl-CoA synthetase alpha subunit|uniref:succinate--CoA ligase subunit alpha n=1 Tax=Methanobacterium sp. TaxID=2164 RepID=UPI003158D839
MIILDENTRCIVQGATGKQGSFHTEQMIAYNTNIVAGTSPGKGGQKLGPVNIYNSVEEAKEENPDINASIIFIPAPFAKDAAFEAISQLDIVTIITEHIPVHDTMEIVEYAKRNDTIVIGPNTPGVITPGVGKLGIMPTHIFNKGNIGIVSRSGTLTYEVANQITNAGMGQSTCLGIGGDPVVGMDFADVLQRFEDDDDTDAMVMIGEIGGNAEENAAKFISKNISKPVVAYIAGVTAPPGKRMGHAGAIIEGESGTAKSKIAALEEAGVTVASAPSEIVKVIKNALK